MHEKRAIRLLPGIFIGPISRIVYADYFKSTFGSLAIVLLAFLSAVTRRADRETSDLIAMTCHERQTAFALVNHDIKRQRHEARRIGIFIVKKLIDRLGSLTGSVSL